jgi:Zn-dependent protease
MGARAPRAAASNIMDQVQQAILYLIAFILSVTVHEFGHAWVATKLGDALPRAQGRLTLSPIHHIDPIGTIVAPLVMSFAGMGIAWGRPVQTNPLSYTRRFSRATGSLLVSVAGPAMNLVMALAVSLVMVVGARVGLLSPAVIEGMFKYLVALNIYLMFFNLLPIPPLDGGSVLGWLLPRSMQPVIDVLERWGFMILLGLLLIPGAMGALMTPARLLIALWGGALGSVLGP